MIRLLLTVSCFVLFLGIEPAGPEPFQEIPGVVEVPLPGLMTAFPKDLKGLPIVELGEHPFGSPGLHVLVPDLERPLVDVARGEPAITIVSPVNRGPTLPQERHTRELAEFLDVRTTHPTRDGVQHR